MCYPATAQREDWGPFGAMNISVGGGVFKIGVSGTLLKRNETIGEQDKDIDAESIAINGKIYYKLKWKE